jgi:hypothetical protein
MQAQGRGVSCGRIERLMHRHGIRAIMAPPRRVRTTDSRHGLPIAPNLIERHFAAAAPNRIWLADITYIPTAEGWLYLAAVMDLFSRKIVGWAMRDHMQVRLVRADHGDPPAAARARIEPPLRSRRAVRFTGLSLSPVGQRHYRINEQQSRLLR